MKTNICICTVLFLVTLTAIVFSLNTDRGDSTRNNQPTLVNVSVKLFGQVRSDELPDLIGVSLEELNERFDLRYFVNKKSTDSSNPYIADHPESSHVEISVEDLLQGRGLIDGGSSDEEVPYKYFVTTESNEVYEVVFDLQGKAVDVFLSDLPLYLFYMLERDAEQDG